MKKITAIMILLTSINCFANPINFEQRIWNHLPINITLPIGKEKIIKFPDSVSLGIPAAIKNDLFIQNDAGWLYLTAKKPFTKKRVEIKDNAAGEILLLNLSAQKNAGSAPLEIIYQQTETQNKTLPNPLQGSLAYATLIRYAEQELYAPARLRKNPYNIQLINSYVTKKGTLTKTQIFYGLFNDHSTINIKWAEWRGGNYYVTAVMVRNMQKTNIDLSRSLPLLCGRANQSWNAVVFFPNWKLAKAGKANDTTMAFLISQKPFEEQMENCK
jgi:integrating conjugative element protein (TIGR03749 family)